MSSPNLDAETDPGANGRTITLLLDPILGHFVWAAHFLLVYIGTALACVLGLGAADPETQAMFKVLLLATTAAAAAIIVLHAILRYRQPQDTTEQRFRARLTVGNDAIALVAIALQLLPILLVPACR
jgi:hypothetical protein